MIWTVVLSFLITKAITIQMNTDSLWSLHGAEKQLCNTQIQNQRAKSG